MFLPLDLFKLYRHFWRERNRDRNSDTSHTGIVFREEDQYKT
ncbi:hypothetical protein GALL_280620 [mine drainage metagenome]|uniref:Uncharacterized protein n=1 Tax=mine drainage metagenome TaxID=410659 RepID=A0A1J5RDH1_9ZZZZ